MYRRSPYCGAHEGSIRFFYCKLQTIIYDDFYIFKYRWKLKLLNPLMFMLFSFVRTLTQTGTEVGKVTFLVRGPCWTNMGS